MKFQNWNQILLVREKLWTPFVKYWKLFILRTLCLYLKTHEPQFFKSVFLTKSISLYAGSDTCEDALEKYATCHGPCYLGSVLGSHLLAHSQGRRGSGWALPDAVSVAASPRHQTRRGLSPATGRVHSHRHGHAKELARWPGPTTEPPSRVPGRA
jgi:hypothetical protein